jgi:putative acyl-CoA dehydrogenase
VELAAGAHDRLDAHVALLKEDLAALDPEDAQYRARSIVERMAVALQASLLVHNAPAAVADAFCAGRLGDGGRVYGTLPKGVDAPAIVERALAA